MRELLTIVIAALAGPMSGVQQANTTVHRLPDGSLLALDPYGDFAETIAQRQSWLPNGRPAALMFRPLSPMQEETGIAEALLLVPSSYAELVYRHDESVVALSPGVGELPREEEYDLAHLGVCVRLFRKVSPRVAQDLAGIVGRWFRQAGKPGVLAEGGISSIVPRLQFCGSEIAFEMHALSAGQTTLITLYLALLMWGITTETPIARIELAAPRHHRVWHVPSVVPIETESGARDGTKPG